mgnify:CR=1 FL=1
MKTAAKVFLILNAVAEKSGVPVYHLRDHGRLTFELSDAGTPALSDPAVTGAADADVRYDYPEIPT